MNLTLFCTAFILQYVGHRIGDYGLQTNTQSIKKPHDPYARLLHSMVYSLVIGLLMLIAFDWTTAFFVFGLTVAEHMIIDSRKPVVDWKNFVEKRLARNKDFNIDDLPFFVIIEIDQTFHIVRIFIISLLIGNGFI